MRAVVVGCGDISVVHLDALQRSDHAELVGVCDVDPTTAERTAQRCGVPGFTDHRRLLAELRPDVVHDCTPHDQHAPVLLGCLAAGAHVLTEKPLAHSLAAGRQMVEAAARHPALKVGVCFQNRYNGPVVAAQELIDSGELGAVLGASATVMWRRTADYYQARPWRGDRARSGGGVLINQAIHTVDLVQWLLGEVTAVRGDIGHYGTQTPEIDVEDTAQLVLQHGPGVHTLFAASSLNVVDAPVEVVIHTERAVLRLQSDLTLTHTDGRTETVAEAPVGTALGRSYWGTSHRLLIEDFYARLPEPEPFWIGPAEAIKATRILAQVYEGPAPGPTG